MNNTQKIIDELNKLVVTVASVDPDGNIESKVMTLEQRLYESCEQSELVSGKWIKENFAMVEYIWNEDDVLEEKNIYCVGAECVYDLGDSYESAKKEMLDCGYVSQLSNVQYFESECYWETIEGAWNVLDYDKENGLVFEEKIDIGWGYTSESQIQKELDNLEYLTLEEKEKIKYALIYFYKTIVLAENMLGGSREDKFVRALLNQLSYDMGEAMITLDEIGYYYENPMEYVEQLKGYNEKELVAIARGEYCDREKELECYGDNEFYEDAQEWVDVLY